MHKMNRKRELVACCLITGALATTTLTVNSHQQHDYNKNNHNNTTGRIRQYHNTVVPFRREFSLQQRYSDANHLANDELQDYDFLLEDKYNFIQQDGANNDSQRVQNDSSDTISKVNNSKSTMNNVTNNATAADANTTDANSSTTNATEIVEIPVVTEEVVRLQKQNETKEDDAVLRKQKQKALSAVDYASKSVGALVLDKSTKEWKGTSNLLNSDRDKYAMVPCISDDKWVVIALSEEILVKQVVLSNYERFSSGMKDFKIWASQTLVDNWIDVGGEFTAKPGSGKTEFDLSPSQQTWARYLKFQFNSHYGDEHYCTISQISVHGSTMVQGFHEQWGEENEQEIQDDTIKADVSKAELEKEIDSDGETVTKESATDTKSEDYDSELSLDADSTTDCTELDSTADKCQSYMGPSYQCVTQLDAVCPKDYNLANAALMFGTNMNTSSDLEVLSALSSASICTRSYSSLSSDALWGSGSYFTDDDGSIRDTAMILAGSKDASQHTPMIQKLQKLIKKSKSENNVQKSDDVKTTTDSAVDKLSSIHSDTTESASSTPTSISAATDSSTANEVDTTAKKKSSVDKEPYMRKSEQKIKMASSSESIVLETTLDISDSTLFFSKTLNRLPSAGCLEKLNFAAFKEAKANTRGAGPGANSGPSNGNSMEPIFKKLTDEIRNLQHGLGVHEQFTKASVSCYQHVILELLEDNEARRADNDARLLAMEARMDNSFAMKMVETILVVGSFASLLFRNSYRYLQHSPLSWLLIYAVAAILVLVIGFSVLLYFFQFDTRIYHHKLQKHNNNYHRTNVDNAISNPNSGDHSSK